MRPAAVPSLIRITKVRRSSRDRSTGLATLPGAIEPEALRAQQRMSAPTHAGTNKDRVTHRTPETRNALPVAGIDKFDRSAAPVTLPCAINVSNTLEILRSIILAVDTVQNRTGAALTASSSGK